MIDDEAWCSVEKIREQVELKCTTSPYNKRVSLAKFCKFQFDTRPSDLCFRNFELFFEWKIGRGKIMAISEFERKRWESLIAKYIDKIRPPAHIRPELDYGFRFNGQSIELYSIKSAWRNPKEKIEGPFAKATYVGTQKTWKVFWQRTDMKWHRYGPVPTVNTLEEFIEVVGKDEFSCFFG